MMNTLVEGFTMCRILYSNCARIFYSDNALIASA